MALVHTNFYAWCFHHPDFPHSNKWSIKCPPFHITQTNEPFLVVAITGYETVTVFTDDYRVNETLWFYNSMPFRRSRGPICDAHLFKVGDLFTTNYSFFDWSIESISKPNAGKSGLFYTGTPLSSCDVLSIYVKGDLHTWQIDSTVVIVCGSQTDPYDVRDSDDDFKVTAKTTFSMSFLPGDYRPIRPIRTTDHQGLGAVLDTTCVSDLFWDDIYLLLILLQYFHGFHRCGI